MNKTWTVMNKRFKIVLLFVLFAGLCFWLMKFLVNKKLEMLLPTENGILEDLVLASFYTGTGLIIYATVVNVTSVLGWVAAYRRKDRVAASTFKGLLLLTFLGTFILFYFLY